MPIADLHPNLGHCEGVIDCCILPWTFDKTHRFPALVMSG